MNTGQTARSPCYKQHPRVGQVGWALAAPDMRPRAQNWPSTFPRRQVEFPSIKQQFPSDFARELSQEAAGTRAFLAHESAKSPGNTILPC